jgi:hypothetical protein
VAKLGRPAVAVAVMGAIVATLFVLFTPRTASRRSAIDPPVSQRPPVRVLVLDFDPVIPDSGGRRMHQAFGWNEPRTLATGYSADVSEASDGRMRYDIAEWRTIDEFPRKRDGFQYTPATYAACLRNHAQCHEPDALDYEALLAGYGVIPLIDLRAIDEVWLFGGPYFGYFESAMAGPGAFDINGDAFSEVPSKRAFAIMGFNSERGVAEMLHNLCHRTEATMARVYGGWQAESLTTAWAQFAANAHQSGGRAGVGSCHYPPNATADYDYTNSRAVESDADDWLQYPNLTGARKRVTAETWGGPDYHRRYMRWWLARLPRAGGTNNDGRLNDWWRYVVDFDELVIRNPSAR